MINPESKNKLPQEEVKIEQPETKERVKPSIQEIQKAFKEKFEPISKKLELRKTSPEKPKPSVQEIQKEFREKFEPISKKLEKREGLEEREEIKETIKPSQEAVPAIEETSSDEKRGWWSAGGKLKTAAKVGALAGGAGLIGAGAAVLGVSVSTSLTVAGGLFAAPFAAYYSLKIFGSLLNSVWLELTGKELFKKKEKK